MLRKLPSETYAPESNTYVALSSMGMDPHPAHSMLQISLRMLTWLRATLVSTTR